MIGGSSHEKALIASLKEAPELRFTIVRKTLSSVESGAVKSTHRLSVALRRVILSISETATDPITIQTCAGFSSRTRAIDPRRAANQSEKIADSFASRIFGETPNHKADGDEWDEVPPLSQVEQSRLIDLQRQFQVFVAGQSVLRPGADSRALILSALDGRKFIMDTVRKVYTHMQCSFDAGGMALTSGPLFSELERILTAQNALPAIDPFAKTYGEELIADLAARN